jgi:hypothetical protein
MVLVVSGTFCSPTAKLLDHKGDPTKDDLIYSSLLREINISRERRATGDGGNSTGNIQEILKNLGKLTYYTASILQKNTKCHGILFIIL